MRIPDPARRVDRRIPTTPACSCPCRRPVRRPGTAALPPARRGPIVDLRRVHDPDAPAARGTRPQPQLPGRLGHRRRAARATTHCQRAGDRRARAGHQSPAPTSAGTTRSTPAAACSCGRRRRGPTRPCRRSTVWAWKQLGAIGHRAHRLPGALGVRRLHVGQALDTMSGAADDWAYEHLGVFGWTTEFWDIVQRGDRHQAVDRLLDRRPDRRARRSPCSGGATSTIPAVTSTGTRSSTPQLGPVELGGWNDLTTVDQPAARTCSRDEVTPHAEFAVRQALCSPRVEMIVARPRRALGDDTWRDRGRHREHAAGCRPTSARRQQPPREPDRRRRRRRAELVGGPGVEVVAGGPARCASRSRRHPDGRRPACALRNAGTTAPPRSARPLAWTAGPRTGRSRPI